MARPILLSFVAATVLTVATTLSADEPSEPDKLFRTLDADGDGTLVIEEIGESQRRAFERLLRVGDADRNGQLTLDEYRAALQPEAPAQLDSPGRPEGQQRGQQPAMDIDRLFRMADRDGDGKIALLDLPERMQSRLRPLYERLDKQELTRQDFEGLRRLQAGQRPQQRFDAGRLFERVDRDGDGRIALSDLPEPMQQRLKPLFDRLGKEELTREDLEQAGRMSGPRSGAEGPLGRPGEGGRPPMALMKVLDADGNGLLNRDELAQLADKFSELDRNGDGQLGVAELIGFERGPRPRGDRRPEGDTPQSRRPRSADDTPSGAPEGRGRSERDPQ